MFCTGSYPHDGNITSSLSPETGLVELILPGAVGTGRSRSYIAPASAFHRPISPGNVNAMPLFRISLFSFLLLLFSLSNLSAATLFAVVSDNSAPDLASGAEAFHQQYPEHQLVFRSASQLMEMTEADLQQRLQDADVVMTLGIFSDAAQRLSGLLTRLPPSRPIIALHSDRRLEKLTRIQGQTILQSLQDTTLADLSSALNSSDDSQRWLAQMLQQYPTLKPWLTAKLYWHHRGRYNIGQLIASALALTDSKIRVQPPKALDPIRFYFQGKIVTLKDLKTRPEQSLVVVLDLDSGDRADNIELHKELCGAVSQLQHQCVGIIAPWGNKTRQALQWLQDRRIAGKLGAIITLQDFLLGGGEGQAEVSALLQQLDVPVLKGIRLHDRTAQEWTLSRDGIPADAVHYRVAMPEMQGISQPMVLATSTDPALDTLTGLRLRYSVPHSGQIDGIAQRVHHWINLQQKPNSEKRVAIIYYNHPPGRHNIGADNLDVPATLWDLLHLLQQEGYNVGQLPASQQALLDLMQEKGVNLPEDYAALKKMAPLVTRLNGDLYRQWFATFPPALIAEMENGPLGYLHQNILQAMQAQKPELAASTRQQVITDVLHLLEGVDHPARDRAINLLKQLDAEYQNILTGKGDIDKASQLLKAITESGIEGIRGWGSAPGKLMVLNNELLLPGLQFGNVFIGPQPPRGWEVNEELLHANLSVPPPHQYLALYQWLQKSFKADALIHLGRHSTYEFLPRHSVGLSEDDYSVLIAGNLPGIYPYIVDGVGEGIQAKRRGLAVMIDHLTPPLSTTPLYDDLLELRQLIETYEANENNADSAAAKRAILNIRQMIDTLNLREELIASMDAELQVRGITFDEVNDELLVHEIGHYLTKLQEKFMPLGLHVFGRDWSEDARKTMLNSMLAGKPGDAKLEQALLQSPLQERTALLHALDGGFVAPGKGNDPIRTPEALPTGRNFHALDGSLLPTRLGYELGRELANSALQKNQQNPAAKEAVILWASDVVRDEGTMIAFGMHLLGIKPVWNSRGILQGIERVPLQDQQQRRDTLFITSGLFRDLYGQQLELLDKAVLMALDGSSQNIRRQFPDLVPALDAALAPLAGASSAGNETLDSNQVAQHWIDETRILLQQGLSADIAGRNASLRLFGSSPGTYGAGINAQAERSGSWNDRSVLGESYAHRMGHAYGVDLRGSAQQQLFQQQLQHVQNTYLGRSSNLYGLIDNNDVFDYLGGLSLAVETLSGNVPANNVMFYADSNKAEVQALDSALLSELRGRFLNPAWMQALMEHDYAGARTMGNEFLENLWGWQVTNPDIIKSWVWDEVKAVYLDDRYQLGMEAFLDAGHNQHVKANMLAIMLVAAMKGFWQADDATLQTLSEELTRLIQENGLPGSGHTAPDHPVFEFVKQHISVAQAKALDVILQAARYPVEATPQVMTHITEITPEATAASTPAAETASSPSANEQNNTALYWMFGLALLLILGALHGRRAH